MTFDSQKMCMQKLWTIPAYRTLIVKTILSQHDAQGKDGGQFLDSDDIGKDSQDNLHVTDVGCSLNRILTGIAIIQGEASEQFA